MEKIEKFILINKQDQEWKSSKHSKIFTSPQPSIDTMTISYGCFYRRSRKPLIKIIGVQNVETARKEY